MVKNLFEKENSLNAKLLKATAYEHFSLNDHNRMLLKSTSARLEVPKKE